MRKHGGRDKFQTPRIVDDLGNRFISKRVIDAIAEMELIELQEAKKWSMRWAILIAAIVLIALIIVCSTILFLVTRNPVTLLPSAALIVSTCLLIIRYAGRFVFWRDDDYTLASRLPQGRSNKEGSENLNSSED